MRTFARFPNPLPMTLAQSASTGFTSPSGTYGVMRQIESASAAPLNQDVEEFVVNAAYKAAWRAWYRSWLDFFNAHAAGDASTWNKLGDFVHSDETALRAESFRRQLEDFYRTYPLERGADGRAVPAPRGKSPLVTSLPKVEKGWPWWAWTLGIGALGGLGYAGYRHMRSARLRGTKRR